MKENELALLLAAIGGGSGGGSLSVDSALSDTSENPVQNRVIANALKNKADVASTSFTVSGNNVSLDLSVGRIMALPNNLYSFVGDANSMIEIGLFRLTSFQYVNSPFSATFSAVIGDELYEIVLYADDFLGHPMTGTLVKRGTITAPSSPATGAFLVYNGSAWVAQTLAAWQGGNY